MNAPCLLHRFKALAAVALAATLLASVAFADPLPGRDVPKFSQKPMVATPIVDINGTVTTYGGHDELSTAYGFSNAASSPQDYSGRFMADDFADRLSSPVVHVRWWGSYLHAQGPQNPNMPVNRFLISFESDFPQGTAGANFSHPDVPLLNQTVRRAPGLTPGSGTFTEKLIRGPDPIVGESLYEYNAELHLNKPFPQLKDTVYWLKIVAMVDVPGSIVFPPTQPPTGVTQWGWHNRDYTIQNTLASNNIAGPPFPPGEAIAGNVRPNVPVWHFQDDAVTGNVRILPTAAGGFLMPQVFQPPTSMSPTNYLDFADGPGPIPGTTLTGISRFSKDLAFELFTIPEPSGTALASVAMMGLVFSRRRRSADA